MWGDLMCVWRKLATSDKEGFQGPEINTRTMKVCKTPVALGVWVLIPGALVRARRPNPGLSRKSGLSGARVPCL
jgi:hypothetical protein